jgi:hypothetical protein
MALREGAEVRPEMFTFRKGQWLHSIRNTDLAMDGRTKPAVPASVGSSHPLMAEILEKGIPRIVVFAVTIGSCIRQRWLGRWNGTNMYTKGTGKLREIKAAKVGA